LCIMKKRGSDPQGRKSLKCQQQERVSSKAPGKLGVMDMNLFDRGNIHTCFMM
jgi:hypothetical protein